MKQILNLCDYYGYVANYGINEHVLNAYYNEPGNEWRKDRDDIYRERNYEQALKYFLKKDLIFHGFDPNIGEQIIKFRKNHNQELYCGND